MNKTRALLLAMLFIVLFVSIQPVYAYPYTPGSDEVKNALSYLAKVQKDDGSIGTYLDSAWALMGIVAAGKENFEDAGGDFEALVNYLEDNWSPSNNPSDYARMILAIVAADRDPTNFGGVDFVAELKGFYDGEKIVNPASPGALSDDFWGLMALIAAGERKDSEIIQKLVEYIKSKQNDDGGWGWAVDASSDVDDTAAAIMALISAGVEPDDEKIQDAIGYLHDQQLDNGGFPFFGASNVGSDSWAICAIVAVGQDPTTGDWVVDGNDPVKDLLRFQDTNDDSPTYGAFGWWGSDNPWPEYGTANALNALVGVPWPVKKLPEKIDTASAETATGAGRVIISCAGDIVNNEIETIDWSNLIAQHPEAATTAPNLNFPYGFFSFSISGLTPGATVEVTIILPSNVPTNVQYWKYHEQEGGWTQIPIGDNDGDRIITITLTDGGTGDDDGVADGDIVDQGGPGIPPAPTPVGGVSVPINRAKVLLSSTLVWLCLATLLIAVAIPVMRRRHPIP